MSGEHGDFYLTFFLVQEGSLPKSVYIGWGRGTVQTTANSS